MAITCHPLTPDRWADFEDLFGKNGACAGCWCMWWRLKRADWERKGNAGNRAAFKAIVEAGPPPGVLAYEGPKAIGWAAVCPRADLPVLGRSPILKPVDDLPVWSVSCFFIRRGHRRQGLTGRLIEAAADFARTRGATTLEAYPWDTDETKSGGTIFTGHANTFAAHGFEAVARRRPHRPIMRRAV